jgi:hypothetical protein
MSNTNSDLQAISNPNSSKLEAFKQKLQSKNSQDINSPTVAPVTDNNENTDSTTPKPKMAKTPEADQGMSTLSQLTKQAIRFFSK